MIKTTKCKELCFDLDEKRINGWRRSGERRWLKEVEEGWII